MKSAIVCSGRGSGARDAGLVEAVVVKAMVNAQNRTIYMMRPYTADQSYDLAT